MPKEGDVIKKYQILKMIGCGDIGEVFLVANDKQYHVLKIVENAGLWEDMKKSLEVGEKCEFLLRYEEIFVGDDESKKLNIVMEYCERGNLANYVKDKERLTDEEIYEFVFESAIAIKTLHDRDMTHGNIKLSKFFMGSNGKFKLGDYGLINLCNRVDLSIRSMDSQKEKNQKTWIRAADVYEWGFVVMKLISNHNSTRTYAHPLIVLASRMMAKDPAMRPSAKDVLAFHSAAASHTPVYKMDLDRQCETEGQHGGKEKETEKGMEKLSHQKEITEKRGKVERLRKERDEAVLRRAEAKKEQERVEKEADRLWASSHFTAIMLEFMRECKLPPQTLHQHGACSLLMDKGYVVCVSVCPERGVASLLAVVGVVPFPTVGNDAAFYKALLTYDRGVRMYGRGDGDSGKGDDVGGGNGSDGSNGSGMDVGECNLAVGVNKEQSVVLSCVMYIRGLSYAYFKKAFATFEKARLLWLDWFTELQMEMLAPVAMLQPAPGLDGPPPTHIPTHGVRGHAAQTSSSE